MHGGGGGGDPERALHKHGRRPRGDSPAVQTQAMRAWSTTGLCAVPLHSVGGCEAVTGADDTVLRVETRRPNDRLSI